MGELPPTAVLGADDGSSRLAAVLEGYLADLQARRAPDRQQLLAAQLGAGGLLEFCLPALEFLHRAPTGGADPSPLRLGDYRIVREIGRGGMGVVYEAEQLSLRRPVALEALRYGGPKDPAGRRKSASKTMRSASLTGHP